MEKHLKACPFCGNKLIAMNYFSGGSGSSCWGEYRIYCNRCECKLLYISEEQGIEAWNTRAEQPASKEPTELSNCCNALATVQGKTTHYYSCDECGKACDVHKIKEPIVESEKANFLWPHADDSLDEFLYEFANAKTEEYRKEIYNSLKDKIQIIIANEIKFAIEQSKPEALVPMDELRIGKFFWSFCNDNPQRDYNKPENMTILLRAICSKFGTPPAKKLPSLELITKTVRDYSAQRMTERNCERIAEAILDLLQEK